MKSERNKVSFQEVEKVADDLSIAVPVLSPDSPMPLDFVGNWDSVKTQLKSAIMNNVAGVQAAVGQRIGFSRWRIKLAVSTDTFFGKVGIMGAGATLGVFGGAFTSFILGSPESFPVAVGGFGGFLGGILLGSHTVGFSVISEQKLNGEVWPEGLLPGAS